MLRWLLRLELRRFIENCSVQYVLIGRVKWDVWFLRELDLDAEVDIQRLAEGDVAFSLAVIRIPRRGRTMKVVAGEVHWPIISKYDGEPRIFFRPL